MVEETLGGSELPRSATVRFPVGVYSLDAIKKAAYRYCDIAVCEIEPGSDEIICTLRFLSDLTPEAAARTADDFRLEVLDQDLRGSVAAETAPLRNAILAYALSRTSLSDE